MSTKISDAVVDAAEKIRVTYLNCASQYGSMSVEERHTRAMRAAIEAALRRLEPTKPEAVRLRDEMRERAVVEKRIVTDRPEGMSSDYVYGRNDCVGFLAATGKQQVGEPTEGGFRASASRQTASAESNAAAEALIADACTQVGEVQGTTVEILGRTYLLSDVEAALAARQPVGQERVAWASTGATGHKVVAMPGLYKLPYGDYDLYAAPPAQTVDLEQLRALADKWAYDRSYNGSPADDLRAFIEQHNKET